MINLLDYMFKNYELNKGLLLAILIYAISDLLKYKLSFKFLLEIACEKKNY